MTVFALAALLAILLCALYLRLALQRGWVARPNARSSHAQPTASGAGVAVFLALALAVTLPLARTGAGVYGALLVLGLLLVPLGFADDLRPLAVRTRLGLYALAAVLACALLAARGRGPGVAQAMAPLFWSLGALWVLSFTNFYNFMDGIDGLAAVQCASAAVVAAMVAQSVGAGEAYRVLCLGLAGVHLGFLLFNWPPARLFLGDAGSVPGGFLLAVLALAGVGTEGFPAAVWPILLAAFLCDALVTLLLRWRRGERLAQAHREHLYQRLAHRFGAHRPVTLGFLCLQWLWLSPLALCCVRWPQWQPLWLLAAYLPLLVIMAKLRRLR